MAPEYLSTCVQSQRLRIIWWATGQSSYGCLLYTSTIKQTDTMTGLQNLAEKHNISFLILEGISGEDIDVITNVDVYKRQVWQPVHTNEIQRTCNAFAEHKRSFLQIGFGAVLFLGGILLEGVASEDVYKRQPSAWLREAIILRRWHWRLSWHRFLKYP